MHLSKRSITSSANCKYLEIFFRSMNYNVRIAYLFSALAGLADGVGNSTALPAYIYLLTGTNAKVGYAEALQGSAEAAAAIPIGLLVDRAKVKRQTVLRFGGFVGLLVAGALAVAVYYEHYYGLCLALLLSGIWNAFNNVPVDAIFADSIPTGQRSSAYNISYGLILTSQAAGPLIAIVIFHYFGNHWTVTECRNVVYVACGTVVGAAITQCLFLDRHKLGEESEAVQVTAAQRDPPAEDAEDNETLIGGGKAALCGWLTPNAVPWIIGASEIVIGFASGMTIKFFPLFFLNEVKLSPIALNILFAVSPLSICLCCTLTQRVSLLIGRIQAVLLFQGVGVGLLVVMAALPQFWTRAEIIMPLYVVRTSVINSAYPVLKSVMMDFVPKKNRGKWAAVSSIVSFGWCGSAALGGVLVDSQGYGFSFVITAILQAVATFMVAFLLPIVPREAKPSTAPAPVPDPKAKERPSSQASSRSNSPADTAQLLP